MDMTNWNGGEGLTPTDAAATFDDANDEGSGLRPYSELLDNWKAEFDLDMRSPLLVVEKCSTPTALEVTFLDRSRPNWRYELSCHSLSQALENIAHLTEKNWVSLKHLRQFALVARQHFDGGKGGAG